MAAKVLFVRRFAGLSTLVFTRVMGFGCAAADLVVWAIAEGRAAAAGVDAYQPRSGSRTRVSRGCDDGPRWMASTRCPSRS